MSETTNPTEQQIPDIIALETEHKAHQERLEELGQEAAELDKARHFNTANIQNARAADKKLVTDWYTDLANTPELYGLSFYLDPPKEEDMPDDPKYIIPRIQLQHFRGKALVDLNNLLSQGPQPVMLFSHEKRTDVSHAVGGFHSFDATIGVTASEEPLSVKYARTVDRMTGTVSLEPKDVVLQLGQNKSLKSMFGGWDDDVWFDGTSPVKERADEQATLLSRFWNNSGGDIARNLTFGQHELISFPTANRFHEIYVGRAAIIAILIESGADIRSQPYDIDTFTAITQTASEIIQEPINVS